MNSARSPAERGWAATTPPSLLRKRTGAVVLRTPVSTRGRKLLGIPPSRVANLTSSEQTSPEQGQAARAQVSATAITIVRDMERSISGWTRDGVKMGLPLQNFARRMMKRGIALIAVIT